MKRRQRFLRPLLHGVDHVRVDGAKLIVCRDDGVFRGTEALRGLKLRGSEYTRRRRSAGSALDLRDFRQRLQRRDRDCKLGTRGQVAVNKRRLLTSAIREHIAAV